MIYATKTHNRCRRSLRSTRIERDTDTARLARRGFTIVEMLIAMVITLLMMAALGRAFALIGETIRDSRIEVDLSVQLRQITRRLTDDLSRCTVRVDRPARQQEGRGYFVYYDGPLSSASGILLGESPSESNESTYQSSKYSDFDDYIAFTAEAEKDNWFSGKVPRFIIDAKQAELDSDYNPTSDPGYDPLEPVVITSKYAEIIYFASPQYATQTDEADPSQEIFVYDTATGTRNPVPLDIDGDLIPDTIRLHRRVLLIRPDLNLNSGALAQYSPSSFSYMMPDVWPADTTTSHPAIKTPGTHGISEAQTDLAWLIGMAVVHQQCDLSVRRVLNRGGRPTTAVAANSLADLTYPHNRFAHVRMPPSADGLPVGLPIPSGTPYGYTSMPLLAMGGPHQLLIRAGTGDNAPSDHVVPPFAPNSGAATVTPLFLNGFLRPEFVLGQDLTHTDYPGDGWGIERRGEDVIASNIVGFDVRGFDRSAAVLLTSGVDGVYGGPGGSGTMADAGASGSDDLAITPGDAGFFEVVRNAAVAQPSPTDVPPQPAVVGMRGAFVDLFYPFQAGGTLRGLEPIRRDIHLTAAGTPGPRVPFDSNNTAIHRRATALLRSDLSAYSSSNHQAMLAGTTSNPYRSYYSDGLFKSGRMLLDGNRRIILLQPAYDTFTDGYERDGFRQDDGLAVGGSGTGTLWWLNHSTTGEPPSGTFRDSLDSGSNGVADASGSGVADDASEQETSPPFAVTMPALQITIRVENPTTRQLQQMSVVQHFGD